jgi:hypothetical protein
MKSTLTFLFIGVFVYTYGVPAFAANTSSGSQNSGTSQQTQEQTAVSNQGATQQIQSQEQTRVQTQLTISSPTGKQVQNQNQVQTQNQGESNSLQVGTQEQEASGGQSGAMSGSSVLENVEMVTKNTEDILNTSMVKGSPGEKIQEIVKSQATAQKEITTEVQKLDSRKGFIKTLIGPDYKAIKTLTQQREQNQLRITELEQLQNQLVNQGDVAMVQETIQALVDQNTALQEKIASEEKTGSVLGWLFKFFAQ